MGKGKVFVILAFVLLAGVSAGYFVYSQSRPFQLGLDLQGGVHLVYEADTSQIPESDVDSAVEGLRDVLERRVNLFGVKEPLVQTEGRGETRRIIVELAGIIDPGEAVELIGLTPFLEFREPRENFEEIAQAGEEDPFQSTALTGRYLKKAEIAFDNVTNEPTVILQFNDEGAKLFEEITARNIGKPLAIYLDYQLLSAPIVQDKISGGSAQITGRFTVQEAQMIARNLNAGALPLPIALVSQQSVGATLGSESLQLSLKAGLLGFLGVLLFMLVFYRFLGFFAVVSLLLYAVFILALFKLIPVTLTLAGIAGFVLSLGMAVDANILIFSRMREELKEGKGFGSAVEEGFRRAWPSIRDGNITTLLVSVILFWFGSSFVQGFALTLSIGILMSMFTAFVVVRNFLNIFTGTRISNIKLLWK
ncbi:MAG: protein-export membrane protein SecD [Candidatus Wildermuthbacteria bacterium RIFCSPLOWO2_01_FULL_48_16]|uniref:Protein translocase subunit SecD n=1 Tax=Candidatus Wildermuthbacteria bacterium RIFCSPLOWO2_01_FULL_48_16 TaxID=1802461 RepID=A0A1G2RLA3_9BACT|nr:MAG: protein-export membrane protein SecD [Candidatus Wildermuthbacteria bacterium RIFCSPHIGHO2_02_FULL_49_12b]OHA73624.1 MAG: protein-export membrane protein SecD [Candidatus Wildermuthbacteria bacterium RIFCSPLOWO2_01_FULL_48_16]